MLSQAYVSSMVLMLLNCSESVFIFLSDQVLCCGTADSQTSLTGSLVVSMGIVMSGELVAFRYV